MRRPVAMSTARSVANTVLRFFVRVSISPAIRPVKRLWHP